LQAAEPHWHCFCSWEPFFY